jgi:hypothetical protein
MANPFETFARKNGPQNAGIFYMQKRSSAARDSTPVADKTALATGSITFAGQPGNSDTITLGGTAVTFGSGHNVAIGANLAATLVTLAAFCNASADTNISKSTYTATDTVLQVKYKTPGIATFTLAASAATRSGPTLALPTITARVPL